MVIVILLLIIIRIKYNVRQNTSKELLYKTHAYGMQVTFKNMKNNIQTKKNTDLGYSFIDDE